MDTPICKFVRDYRSREYTRFHMPGHKGESFLGPESLDITEVYGADALYEAEGIIAESECNATALFSFGRTVYSTEGSSQCIKAMLFLARLQARLNGNLSNQIIAARNVHKAFIHGCALVDLQPVWLWPEKDTDSLCSCPVSPQTVETCLSGLKTLPVAVYLTSPDYLGGMQDVAGIAAVCRRFGVPLLVDNAHGAYLRFLEPSQHPISLGAWMTSDSAHKTLPVLTGGAYLQIAADVPETVASQAKQAMALFGSTSPSYLILQSLDLCNKILEERYMEALPVFLRELDAVKAALSAQGWTVLPSDPLKLVLRTVDSGYTGEAFSNSLYEKKIACEFADLQSVVLMMTPCNTREELQMLVSALSNIPQKSPILAEVPHRMPEGEAVCSVREAVLAPHTLLPIESAVGRVCAAPVVSCPPAIPIAVSGERITQAHLELFRAYQVQQVEVIAEACDL